MMIFHGNYNKEHDSWTFELAPSYLRFYLLVDNHNQEQETRVYLDDEHVLTVPKSTSGVEFRRLLESGEHTVRFEGGNGYVLGKSEIT